MNLSNECLDQIEMFQNGQITAKDLNDSLFDALVPMENQAPTFGGEILRAINRIAYRWFNDGDKAGDGYGRETVNPAVRYLRAKLDTFSYRKSTFSQIVNDFFMLVLDDFVSDAGYQEMIDSLVDEGLRFIVDNELWEEPNNEDMFEYADRNDTDVSGYEEEEEWEDEDDDY